MKLTGLTCLLSLLLMPLFTYAKTITVALDPLGYRPYYYNEEGKVKGAVIEIVEHLSKQLGHTIEYKEYPWARMQHYLRKGRVDLLLVYLKTPERLEYAYFPITPTFYETYYLYASTHNPKAFDGHLRSLTGLSIGEVRGYSYGEEYDSFALLDRFKVGSEGQLLRMLLKNRVDLVIANQAVMNVHLKALQVENKIHKVTPMIAKTPAYFAFSKRVKGNEALAAAFSKALENFVTTQKYRDILKRYGIEGSCKK